jgi:hypothetical protein
MRQKRQKLTSASWLRPVCGGFHNLILFNGVPFFASYRRHRVLTVTCLDACRCAAYLSLHRPTSSSSSTTNFPWLSPTENWLTRSADCLQDNSSARIPRKTPSSFIKDACLELRCLAIDVLLFRAFAWRGPHRKHSFPYVVTFLRGVSYPLLGNDLETNNETSVLGNILWQTPGNLGRCHSTDSWLPMSYPR